MIPSNPGEEWRDIRTWEGQYKVSNQGRVYSIRHDKLCNVRPGKAGCVVCLRAFGRKGRHENTLVHRLVMMAFNPIPNYRSFEIGFKNDDKNDPRLENLIWKPFGRNARLSSDDVRTIRARWRAGESCSALARAYGVSTVCISNVISGNTYTYIN
jgi:hypothetical protein